MLEFEQKEKLESKIETLEEILKHFNRDQTFGLLTSGLIFYVGKQFDTPILEYIGYFGFGCLILNAVLYPGLCKDYNLMKKDLEDKTGYDSQIS